MYVNQVDDCLLSLSPRQFVDFYCKENLTELSIRWAPLRRTLKVGLYRIQVSHFTVTELSSRWTLEVRFYCTSVTHFTTYELFIKWTPL